MKYVPHVIIGLVAVASLYFGIIKQEPSQADNGSQKEQSADTGENSFETQINEQPPVTVKVTPLELRTNNENWKFQVVLDTHSGSLDDDPLTVATLVDDMGKEYRPIAWEGQGTGGHHREGVLIFEPVIPAPSYVELKIKNVGGVPERSFNWNIE